MIRRMLNQTVPMPLWLYVPLACAGVACLAAAAMMVARWMQ